jgi:hypothetical protein
MRLYTAESSRLNAGVLLSTLVPEVADELMNQPYSSNLKLFDGTIRDFKNVVQYMLVLGTSFPHSRHHFVYLLQQEIENVLMN